MIDKAQIRYAFRNALKSISGLPDWDTRWAWENTDFTPPAPAGDDPADSLWVRETYLKGPEPLKAIGYVEESSIMQYDVFAPAGGGTEKAEAAAKSIGDALKAGTGLNATGSPGLTANFNPDPSTFPTQIAVYMAVQGMGADVRAFGGAWWMIPVRIYFRAYGAN